MQLVIGGRKRYRQTNPSRGTDNITAAAVRVNPAADQADQLYRQTQAWQMASFGFYDTDGACWYASQFYSRALAKVRLFAAKRSEDGEIQEVEEGSWASQQMDRLKDPGGGRSQLLSAFGRLMFLIGEGYLVASETSDGEQWEFLSPSEIRVIPGGSGYMRVRYPGSTPMQLRDAGADELEPPETEDGDVVVAYRVWRRHPQFTWLADAPMRPVLGLFEELALLQLAVGARAKSRAAGSGILLRAAEISWGSPDGQNDDDNQSDRVAQRLQDAIVRPITNPGTASAAAPIILEAPAEMIKEGSVLSHISLSNPLETYPEENLRAELIRRIAIGLDLPPEILLGMADANHWCSDQETEVLTRDRGWVKHDDLSVGDHVRTLNHATGLAEWEPVLGIYRADTQDEPMRSLENQRHSSLTTLNHRWPVLRERQKDHVVTEVREWSVSDELTYAHRIPICAPASDLPAVQTVSDDLVELVAWFCTEGSIGSGGNRVTIAQSHTANPDRVRRIQALLRRMYGDPVARLNGNPDGEWAEAKQENRGSFGGPVTVFRLNQAATSQLLEAAPAKMATREFILSLTLSQLELFIDVTCQADGHHYRDGRLDLWQKNPEAVEAFELAVILSGRGVSLKPSHDGGTTVRALDSKTVRPVKAETSPTVVSYTGVVWCPVTGNQTWLARRNGYTYFTGNTAWQIDDQTWSAHLQPVVQQLCDDLGASFLRPLARQEGQSDADELVVSYDAAEVVNHPDRAKDAKELNRLGLLSGVKTLEANGFNAEADQMGAEEHAEWLAIQLHDVSLIGPDATTQAGTDAALDDTGANSSVEVEPGIPEQSALEDEDTGVTAGAVMGAATLALERCRELAGSRLVSLARKPSGCPECAERVRDMPNSLVASALGTEQILALAATPAALVAGGADGFQRMLERDGWKKPNARKVALMLEAHAGATLTGEQPALPRGFQTTVRRMLAS